MSRKARVSLAGKTGGSSFRVTAEGFEGDLSQAASRREWLRAAFKLKEKGVLQVGGVLDADAAESLSPKAVGKLLFVLGDELDVDGHEGQLKLTGSEEHLERYARCVRRLREAGFATVAVVTDHGFFHWDPEAHEKDLARPEGEVRFEARRAMAGHDLRHGSALCLKVTASDLDCSVPRGVAVFKTHGGLGYFHGGATLQELVIPVVVARWPRKARKIAVTLKPIAQITALSQRVELQPERVKDLVGHVDQNVTGLQVVVKVVDRKSGAVLLRSKAAVLVEPGADSVALELSRVEGTSAHAGAALDLQAMDADNEEVLDRCEVTLKIELDEWF
ncbi:MAG: hypothetical protein HY721_11680 [Planctomycetes bacterium]|nr:hypothetical protein [Planctomycetota bacterium]